MQRYGSPTDREKKVLLTSPRPSKRNDLGDEEDGGRAVSALANVPQAEIVNKGMKELLFSNFMDSLPDQNAVSMLL